MPKGIGGWRRSGPYWALLAVAALTRLPLLSGMQGEPDSARFVLAVWQWMQGGSHPVAHVYPYSYYPVLAPGYFVLTAHLAAWAHVTALKLGLFLNLLSAAAALATGPLLYRVGRRFLPDPVAWVAALLFLLAPGVWWLGIEAHPQGLSLLAFLVGLDLVLAGRAWWAGVAFTAALLLRCDAILLFPLAAVAWWLAGRRSRRDRWMVAAAAAASVVAFELLRAGILGESLSALGRASTRTVAQFWGQTGLMHQLLPVLTAPGVAVAGLAALGIALLAWRRHRMTWLAVSALPGLIFWLAITGNNTRHVAALWLPLLWAGCFGVWHWRRRALVPAALAALALSWIVIPPNSNVTLYPSADVYAAHRLLAAKERQVDTMAATLHTDALKDSFLPCFVGASASPYALDTLLLRPQPPRLLPVTSQWLRLRWPDGAQAFVIDAYNDREFVQVQRRCDHPLSLEYAAPDRHLWFWGSELGATGWMARSERWAHRYDMRHTDAVMTVPDGAAAAPLSPR